MEKSIGPSQSFSVTRQLHYLLLHLWYPSGSRGSSWKEGTDYSDRSR